MHDHLAAQEAHIGTARQRQRDHLMVIEDNDSMPAANAADDNDVMNLELSGDMLPLSMRQHTIDEMKKLSMADNSHLVSFIKTESSQQMMT